MEKNFDSDLFFSIDRSKEGVMLGFSFLLTQKFKCEKKWHDVYILFSLHPYFKKVDLSYNFKLQSVAKRLQLTLFPIKYLSFYRIRNTSEQYSLSMTINSH